MLIVEQIAEYLSNKNILLYDKNSNLSQIYINNILEKDSMLGIYNRQGQPTESRGTYRKEGIQLLYKGSRRPIDSTIKAKQIYDSLISFSGFFVDGGNYIVDCSSMQGGPEHIGYDKKGNLEFSINFIVDYKL